MFSPALRNRQRILAAQQGKAEQKAARKGRKAPGQVKADSAAGQEYAALRAVLHDRLRSLSDIASHEQRQPKKAEYAKDFAPWIEGVLAADQPVQDEVLLVNMIWAIDYRDFDYALKLGAFALEHGLAMPEQYNRTVACFLAEDIAEIALAQHEEVAHETLLAVARLVEGFDMPDPVTAKLLKAMGRSWYRKAEGFDPSSENAPAGGALAFADEAGKAFDRALKLFAQVGVKKDIQAVASLRKKLAAASEE